MKKSRPLFITIEGIEGAGKSTSAKSVVKHLESLGLTVLHTREPGGTYVAEKIRNILLEKNFSERITNETELLLLFASRSQHLDNLIFPALNAGQTVVCERFTDATFAYQGGGRGMNLEHIQFLENLVQKTFRPDLTLLFDVDVAIGLERIKLRGTIDRIEQEKIDFFNKARLTYLKIATNNSKYIIIDANQDLNSVNQQIKKQLDHFLYANKLFESTTQT